MANQESTTVRADARRVPTVRPISWPSTIPQLIALAMTCAIGWSATHSAAGVMFGAITYLIYSYAARTLIPRAHRHGIRLSLKQQYSQAIPWHLRSYEFFSRHPWLDRYRAITMMSPSAMSFREMALINIAFANSQIGNGQEAKTFYRRALEEFPTSGMASAALRMIEAIENNHEGKGNRQ